MKSPSPFFICTNCARALRTRNAAVAARNISTTPLKKAAQDASISESPQNIPRWKQTPPAMKMPVRLRTRPNQPVWTVNEKQEPVDEAYDNFLGKIGGNVRGRDMLDEETKWLALTHKSFDHGRRGFNDRLAFLGKRIVDLQTSLALLRAPSTPDQIFPEHEIFQHSSLHGVENITDYAKQNILDKTRLAGLAHSYGLQKVVRWKPKKSDNLQGSGVDTVLAHTLYSIVGALALQKGGEVAARTARERILRPLGLR